MPGGLQTRFRGDAAGGPDGRVRRAGLQNVRKECRILSTNPATWRDEEQAFQENGQTRAKSKSVRWGAPPAGPGGPGRRAGGGRGGDRRGRRETEPRGQPAGGGRGGFGGRAGGAGGVFRRGAGRHRPGVRRRDAPAPGARHAVAGNSPQVVQDPGRRGGRRCAAPAEPSLRRAGGGGRGGGGGAAAAGQTRGGSRAASAD